MADDFKFAQPREYLRLFLKDNIRPDGRPVTGCREVKVHCNTVKSALGSAMVCYGNTRVICGVKGKFAAPTINNPNSGYVIPNLTLPALCNSKYRPGAPDPYSVSVSHKLNEIVTDMIDLMELCIVTGKVVWSLYVDVVCVTDDGNVFDAVVLALAAALFNTKLPATVVHEESGCVTIDPNGDKEALELRFIPICVTIAVFDDTLLPDPTEFEEDIRSGTISCCMDNNHKIRAMWSSSHMSDDLISAALQYIDKRSSVLLSVMKKVSNHNT